MLKVENLNVNYGAIHAIKGVSFDVKKGEIVTLIGANGAGKSTILRAISGLVKPSGGSVMYQRNEGESPRSLMNVPAHKLVDLGISHVPEGRRIFANLTVLDNLELGSYHRKDKAGIAEDMEWAFVLFPRLKERRRQVAGTLSGGEQQMLATARGLMSRPDLLLMDEPSMGLAPILVREIFDTVALINKRGVTILIVEQNANMALSLANRAFVLEVGKIVLEGSAAELSCDEKVREAYLGGK
ncbi:MAG TPA: ABC transporter ATP-binding protein [Bacillota bacterium]|nr:ABC transporter ATP-binding protein [Bacillota bacterium]HPU95705.1 ABC transporter ATP-binding protein [Bacillota bacterium]HQJ25556.1 ABC transporter ATP-binding protein [Bacillota bacterium]